MGEETGNSFIEMETQIKCEIVNEISDIKSEVFDDSFAAEHDIYDLKIEEEYRMDFEEAIKNECGSYSSDISQSCTSRTQCSNVLDIIHCQNSTDLHSNETSTSNADHRPEETIVPTKHRKKKRKSTKSSSRKSIDIQSSHSPRKRKKSDDITYVCGFCTKTFMNSKDFFSHMNSHTGYKSNVENSYNCQLKDSSKVKNKRNDANKLNKNSSYKSKAQIKRKSKNNIEKTEIIPIKQESNESIEAKYQCDECTQMFTYKGNLSRHKILHRKDIQKVVCDFCKKAYNRKSYLAKHIKAVHWKMGNDIKFACNLCKKTVTTAYTLRCHMQVHTGRKPFQCNICMKGFSNKWNLKIHSNTHKQLK